jgi:hypothetical protein
MMMRSQHRSLSIVPWITSEFTRHLCRSLFDVASDRRTGRTVHHAGLRMVIFETENLSSVFTGNLDCVRRCELSTLNRLNPDSENTTAGDNTFAAGCRF